jgi:hypothetical protein
MRSLTIIIAFLFSASLLFSQEASRGSEFCSLKKSNSPESFISSSITADIKHSYDALDYKLDLDIYSCFISPYPKSFKGSVIVTFRVDSTLNAIKLDAVNTSLVIDSVRLAGISYTHIGNVLNITLDRTYNVGETAAVKVYYRHNNVSR